ncbi:hypothetical protein JCM3775_004461 [Rhodotorula graminis]|uniref:GST C-terminal domain-containing protein n=1 Tax=Rhodotorula graminis (strain WP1) TaxID=578459 RepID=A0A194S4J2_RHOGW|nr:uncharacterized protein RHOBADRAFT_48454 [Rhodotorula graminis WP1]KPV75502.1 hypothetical protein RHOBADRAFT_48454 [Rhodotorula graminis WP1]
MPADITAWASKEDGQFRRQPSTFRDSIKVGGQFPPEEGRYLLYVSLACPWAHRTLIVRKLKGLERFIDVVTVHPVMLSQGWALGTPKRNSDGSYDQDEKEVTDDDDGIAGVDRDPQYGAKHIRDLYFKVNPDYTGRFTVPVLWDKKTEQIVNNESSEIIRFFNSEFNSLLDDEHANIDLYPESGRAEIDDQADWVYNNVNNGVYKCGFATTQKAYESNMGPLFDSLERLDKLLADRKYVAGTDNISEADVRLYTTIVRFDVTYYTHFKTDLGMIRYDYPNLHRWLRELYWQNDAFKSTTNFEHIKTHYTKSHPQINPSRITHLGPVPAIKPL